MPSETVTVPVGESPLPPTDTEYVIGPGSVGDGGTTRLTVGDSVRIPGWDAPRPTSPAAVQNVAEIQATLSTEKFPLLFETGELVQELPSNPRM